MYLRTSYFCRQLWNCTVRSTYVAHLKSNKKTYVRTAQVIMLADFRALTSSAIRLLSSDTSVGMYLVRMYVCTYVPIRISQQL